jgi:hypothetical protein
MNRFEALIRAILWLSKRDWGRSILLGFASLVALAVIPGENTIRDAILEGPVFRAGFYVGTVLMPRETIGGHSLFGLAADILMLIGFWFIALYLGHCLFAKKTAEFPSDGL